MLILFQPMASRKLYLFATVFVVATLVVTAKETSVEVSKHTAFSSSKLAVHDEFLQMKLLQELSELQNIQGHDLPIPVGNLSKTKHDALVTLRASIISWAPTHADPKVIAQPNCDTPNRVSCDCTFWNGIACSNAQNDTHFSCNEPWESQSPNGMIWRSPWEAAMQNSTNPDFFSRDQGLGVLCHLSNSNAVNVTSWYNKWWDFIDGNKASMCPGGFYDCKFVTPFWCTFDTVASKRGLKPPKESWMLPRFGKGACNNQNLYIYISCKYNDNGSALHLAALDVYIRRQLNIWDEVLQNSANVLHKRDPQNAFFRWLSEGTSDGLADLVISQVPKDKNHKMQQWAFVREDSSKAWEESMGWDYIFLIDHLLKAPVV
jgi:hypothetical protein